MGNPPPVQVGALWSRLDTAGTRIGNTKAKVTIAEFIDFECPFCASYAPVLRSLIREFQDSVGISVHHFPLEMHRFAEIAAQSVECARDQGRFGEMHDVLLAKQDSFGLKPWSEFAHEAGIPDTTTFVACAKTTPISPRIAAGLELGKEMGVRGTPTFVVNGWHMYHPPSEKEMRRVITALLRGENPFPEGLRRGS